MTQDCSRGAVLQHNLRQLLIAIDQLVNAVFGAVVAMLAWLRLQRRPADLWWADETISAHCWRWHVHGVRHWPQRLVDRVAALFGDKDHCQQSFMSEREGRQLPPEARP